MAPAYRIICEHDTVINKVQSSISRILSIIFSNLRSSCADSGLLSFLFKISGKKNELIKGREIDDPSTPIIPTTYHQINDGPSPGIVVGIVLGSVAGVLFLFLLCYKMLCIGADRGELRPLNSVNRSSRRTRRNHGNSRYARSRTKRMRSRHQPRVRVKRPMQTVPPSSRYHSTSRSSKYASSGRPDDFMRYQSTERKSNRQNSGPRNSDEIIVIEEPRRSAGGGRNSRESRRSRDVGRHSSYRSYSRGVR